MRVISFEARAAEDSASEVGEVTCLLARRRRRPG
jgi:hypothetical protein